jgi:hypothetical protein
VSENVKVINLDDVVCLDPLSEAKTPCNDKTLPGDKNNRFEGIHYSDPGADFMLPHFYYKIFKSMEFYDL